MKKVFSVFALLARSVLGPLLGIALAAGAVQAALFAGAVRAGGDEGLSVFEVLIGRSGFGIVSGLGLAALCVLLCRCCAGGASRCRYTVGRLAVSETCFFWLQAAAGCLAVLIYWGLQLLTVLALGAWYLRQPLAAGGASALPLAFWRSAFLHGLLPGADGARWAANLLLLPALGVCTAAYAQCQRRRRRSALVAAVVPASAVTFLLGSENAAGWLFLAAGCALAAAAAALQALRQDAED